MTLSHNTITIPAVLQYPPEGHLIEHHIHLHKIVVGGDNILREFGGAMSPATNLLAICVMCVHSGTEKFCALLLDLIRIRFIRATKDPGIRCGNI